jgi:hypothetical protein
VFYLSSPDNVVTKDDIAELEKELKAAGADVAAFDYVRRMREISRMTMSSSIGGSSTPTMGSAGQGGELFKGFSALGNRVQRSSTLSIVFLYSISQLAHRPLEGRRARKLDFGCQELPSD